jgi:hypothetical protein
MSRSQGRPRSNWSNVSTSGRWLADDNEGHLDTDQLVAAQQQECVALLAVLLDAAQTTPSSPVGLVRLRDLRLGLEAAAMPLLRPSTSTKSDADTLALIRSRVRAAIGGSHV